MRNLNSPLSRFFIKISIVNELKAEENIDMNIFLEQFIGLTAVWKIFLLHIIKPDKYPIYDQHIHRAYNFINGLDYKNISADEVSNSDKESFYFKTYFVFIKSLKNPNLKTLDEAFFAFGQFINTRTYVQIVD